MNCEKVYALLPMKGHSERVKNKNLKMFNGKPLYSHVLNSLLACEGVDGIYIDTDSMEIAVSARNYSSKVRIIERPKELCGDFVSMNQIIEYDISLIDAEHFVQTHATNPLLKSETIDRAIEQYFCGLNAYDSLFSVNELHVRLYDKDARAVNHNPSELIRTQDLPALYEENSNLYIFSKTSFAANQARIGKKPQMFISDPLEAVDIDIEADFVLAEQLQKLQMERMKQ